jgi:hypothetical protein
MLLRRKLIKTRLYKRRGRDNISVDDCENTTYTNVEYKQTIQQTRHEQKYKIS